MPILLRLRAQVHAAVLAAWVALCACAPGTVQAADPYGTATALDAAEQLLDFAESRYPQFFPTRELTQSFGKYRYRYYPTLGTYVGVAVGVAPGDGLVEGGVYVLGGSLGASPSLVGVLNQFIAPTASPVVRITLELHSSAPQWPGPVYLRAGAAAIGRADMTFLDAGCIPNAPGTKSCTFNVRRGETVTLVANDQQATVEFFSKPYVATREADPRDIRSQFNGFGAPCTATPQRGVCSFTASADRTITVDYTPLRLTRMKFIGEGEWKILIDARPNLNIGNELRTERQGVSVISRLTPGLAACFPGEVATTCYDIFAPDDSSIIFEALDPPGPAPLGSSGPLRFIGYENACGSSALCVLDGGPVEQVVTMKWQYYRCPTGTSHPRWNLGVKWLDCVLVTPG